MLFCFKYNLDATQWIRGGVQCHFQYLYLYLFTATNILIYTCVQI